MGLLTNGPSDYKADTGVDGWKGETISTISVCAL